MTLLRKVSDVVLQSWLVVAAIAISYIFNPSVIPEYEVDTGGYVDVAKDIKSPSAMYRPIGYPALLGTALFVSRVGLPWEQAAILIQMLFSGLMALIAYKIILMLDVRRSLAAFGAVLVVLAPRLVRYQSALLPEYVLALALLFVVMLALYAIREIDPRRVMIIGVLYGLANAAAVLLKPVWSLSILSIILTSFLVVRKRWCIRWPFAALAIAAYLIPILGWMSYVHHHHGVWTLSKIGNVNINLIAIRCGLIEMGRGTPLYEHLKKEGLLEHARSLRYDDYSGFERIKEAADTQMRADPTFTHAVVPRGMLKISAMQMKNTFNFFSCRSSVHDEWMPWLPDVVRSWYFRVWDWYYRPILPIALLLSLIVLLMKHEIRPSVIVLYANIAIYAAVVIMTSYQTQNFLRFRAAIDPILMIVALVTCANLYDAIRSRLFSSRFNM